MLLHGSLDAGVFLSAIQGELSEYARGWSERGCSSPVVVTGSSRIDLNARDIVKLIDLFKSRQLTPEAFRYVIDAIILDDHLNVNEGLFEILCSF